MNPRTALASLALCVPCLLAAQPDPQHTAHFDITQGIPLVHIKIDGQGPFAFVIDTGTNCEAIVSPRLAKRLRLPVTGHQSITDLGGHGAHFLDTVELKTLSLAGNDFRLLHAVVTDLPDGDSVLDGILGFGLFRNHLLTLDYPHRRLILDQGSLAGSNDQHVLSMRTPDGIPVVDIEVAGTRMQAAIDSGAIGLSIPASISSKVRFATSVDTVAYGRTQVSGFALRGAVLNGAVQFAGFRFEQPWLELNPIFTIANIGSGALRDFSVTFDQRSKIVRFTSPSKLHRLTKLGNLTGATPLDELIGTVTLTQSY